LTLPFYIDKQDCVFSVIDKYPGLVILTVMFGISGQVLHYLRYKTMDTVSKADIIEIKSFHAPPQLVKDTLEAILLLLGYSSAKASVSKNQD
jgi:hypothetical protein